MNSITECMASHKLQGALPRIGCLPVSFIKYDDFVAARGQGDLLLSKHLNLVANHIYTSAWQTALGLLCTLWLKHVSSGKCILMPTSLCLFVVVPLELQRESVGQLDVYQMQQATLQDWHPSTASPHSVYRSSEALSSSTASR